MKFNRAVHPEYVQVNDDDHFVVKSIKDRLNKAGGHARIPMISAGKVMDIGYDSDDNGLECDKIPVPNLYLPCVWDCSTQPIDCKVRKMR